jgi:hypothetical protein
MEDHLRPAHLRRGLVRQPQGPSNENLRRGFFRLTGLGAVTVLIALGIAACNILQLRLARAHRPRRSHPLLRPAEPDHGFVELTTEQAAALDAARRAA